MICTLSSHVTLTFLQERDRSDALEADKEAYEKKCRDLESKVLSLQAELEDNNEKLMDSERIRKQVSRSGQDLRVVATAVVTFCCLNNTVSY